MVTINQALKATEAVSAPKIELYPEWCSCVRNRNANCSACVDACPHAAIAAGENELLINPDACTGCGACATACPTQAIATARPSRSQTAHKASIISETSARLAYCCAHAGLSSSDDARFIDVECLAQLDEAELAQATMQGCTLIALVSGECASCPNAKAEQLIQSTMQQLCSLMDHWKIQGAITRRTATNEAHGANPEKRREALQEILGDARNAAARTAIKAIEEPKEPKTLAGSLTQGVGNLKKRVPPRNTALLNQLFELPQRPEGPWQTRLFGQVHTDESLCRHCGKCSFFCPTGALAQVGEAARQTVMGIASEPADPAYHTFRTCDCVRCNLCADVCPNGAIAIGDAESSKLFDLEPEPLP